MDLFLIYGTGAAMVEALTCKVTAWEKETGTEFSYDGVSTLLILSLLWAGCLIFIYSSHFCFVI